MKKLFTTVLLCIMTALGASAQGTVLPKPVYTQDFEKATDLSSVGTLVGKGEIATDPVFGKYYQNMPGLRTNTLRGNYLAINNPNIFERISDSGTGELTVSFWVNTTAMLNQGMSVQWNPLLTAYTAASFEGEGGAKPNYLYRALDIRANGSSHALFSFYAFHNTHDSNPRFTEHLDWSKVAGWHHVAYVMSKDYSHVTYYIDGEVIEDFDINVKVQAGSYASVMATNNGWQYSANNTYVNSMWEAEYIVLGGCSAEWNDNDSPLGYDELNFYQEALTATQVKKIHVEKVGPTQAEAIFKTRSVTLVPGDKKIPQTIKTTSDSENITYTSSNPAVATVDPKTGEVTVVGLGVTTIKAVVAASEFFTSAEDSYTLKVAETPYPQEVLHFTFDNDKNPDFFPASGARGYWDASHTLQGERGNFLVYHGDNASKTTYTFDILPDRDLAAEGVPAWQLDYDMAFYNGCNNYVRNNILRAGTEELVNIEFNNNWGAYGTLYYNNRAGNVELFAEGCDRNNRGEVNLIANLFADRNNDWYHFTLVGSKNGVYLTVQRYGTDGELDPNGIVLKKIKVSDNYVTPTNMTLAGNSMGAVAIDEMNLQLTDAVDEMADYTFRYLDVNGNKIREDKTVVAGVVVGETFTALETDMQKFMGDQPGNTDKKYRYVEGNEVKKATNKGSQNVINLVFEEIPVFDFKVVASSGGVILGTLAEGTQFDEEVGRTVWSKFMKFNNKWYACEQYAQEFTEAGVVNIDFTPANISDFIECENMVSSKQYGVYSSSHFSGNGCAAPAANSTVTSAEKIPAGMYNFNIGFVQRQPGESKTSPLVFYISSTGEDGSWEKVGNDIVVPGMRYEWDAQSIDIEGVSIAEDSYIRISNETAYNTAHYIDYITLTEATNFNVRFEDESGYLIKTVQHPCVVGNVYSALPEDMASFMSSDNNTRYEYVRGNMEQIADRNVAKNNITLVFRKLDQFAYGIYATYKGVRVGKLGEGNAFADGSTTVQWSKYMYFEDPETGEGQWYKTETTTYSKQLTESYFANVEFEPVNITYFMEAEKMEFDKAPAASVSGTDYSGGSAPRHLYGSTWWTDQKFEPGKYVVQVYYSNPNSHLSDLQIVTRDDNGNNIPTGSDMLHLYPVTTGYSEVHEVVIDYDSYIGINNPSNANNSNGYIDYIVITQPTTYTIRYITVDGDMAKKTSDPRATNVHLKYHAEDSDLETFYSDDMKVKYVFQEYLDEIDENVAVSDETQNYITLVFQYYDKHEFTLKAVADGQEIADLNTNGILAYSDGDSSIKWNKFLKVGDTWYETDVYAQLITSSEDYTIDFVESDVTQYFECEDMSQSSVNNALGEGDSYSNAAGMRLYKNEHMTTVPVEGKNISNGTVSPGIYDVAVAGVYKTTGNTSLQIKKSTDGVNWEDVGSVLTLPSRKTTEAIISGVKLTEDTYFGIFSAQSTNTPHFLDYLSFAPVYEPVVIGKNGYSTYCSDNDWVVPAAAKVRVFTASVLGNNVVKLTSVAPGTVISAGEGVMLRGTEGQIVKLFLSAFEGMLLPDNDFIGVNSATAGFVDGDRYVLASKDTETAFVHMKYSKTYPEYMNKAYIVMPEGVSLNSISFIFDDEFDATGAASIEADETENEQFVNTAGQSVNKNYRGVKIGADGRKTFNK